MVSEKIGSITEVNMVQASPRGISKSTLNRLERRKFMEIVKHMKYEIYSKQEKKRIKAYSYHAGGAKTCGMAIQVATCREIVTTDGSQTHRFRRQN